MKSKKVLMIVCALVALFGVTVEFFSTVDFAIVPEAKVFVLDRSGQPVANWKVTQTWELLSTGSFEEVRLTNKDGVTVFPERTMELPRYKVHLSQLAVLMTVISPHASYGPHSYIFCERSKNGITYNGSGPSGGTLTLKD